MKDLTAQAKVLADRVGGLSLAVEHLDRRTIRSEKVVAAVVVGLLLDLVLSVVVAVVLVQLNNSNAEITATQLREQHTRQDALCPLYSLILGSYRPESRPEGPDRQAYIDQFKVMREAYAALDCQTPLVPPPIRR